MKTREVKRSPKEFQYGLCLLGGGNQPNKLSTKDFPHVMAMICFSSKTINLDYLPQI